jgi:Family of unknown function (DUF6445)
VFSENFKIQAAPIYGDVHAFVVDNALADPNALVQFAKRVQNAFAPNPLDTFPGIELRMADSFNAKFDNFFRVHLRRFFDARRTLAYYTNLSIATLKPNELRASQCLPHRDDHRTAADECIVACELYLFDDPSLGGTGFYAPKLPPEKMRVLFRDQAQLGNNEFVAKYKIPRNYCTASNDYFDLVQVVQPKYNRLVFYDGALFQSEHIASPEKISMDATTGRLTLNGFFRCKRHASALANRRYS